MKTYENEFQELKEWQLIERHKLEKEADEKYGLGAFDGVPPEKLKAISQEFWAKVAELRKKYGITTKTTPTEPAAVKPVIAAANANLNYASGK